MSTILSKQYTRSYSVLCVVGWCESGTQRSKPWVGYNNANVLFINEGNGKKFTLWYGPDEDSWVGGIEKGINTDPTYFSRARDAFYEHWPWLIGQRKIETFADFKEFWRHYVLWWAPMAVILDTPNANVPEAIKEQAIKIREETQEYSEMDEEVFGPFLEKNFPQYSGLVSIITPQEILSLEQGDFSVEQLQKIRSRVNGYVYYNDKMYEPADLPKILKDNDLVLQSSEDGLNDKEKKLLVKHEFRGMSAFRGKVKGRVRLILEKSQLGQFQEGEILVSEMTTPDFVPAMQKAAAFVTDEGGITCHAAIVAREMNKPCIVGTKFATTVLKDGDMVEVDAERGIVKILK